MTRVALIALALLAAAPATAGQGGMASLDYSTRNFNRHATVRHELRMERFCTTQIRCSGGVCGRTCWTEPARGAVIERRP